MTGTPHELRATFVTHAVTTVQCWCDGRRTSRWSRPLARVRSPRLLTMTAMRPGALLVLWSDGQRAAGD